MQATSSRPSRGVQPHEVAAAADALLAERTRPTIERVRAKLGRGSPNAVAPMLESWFASLAPRLGIAEPAQDQMPAAVRQAMELVWKAAQGVADAAAREELAGDRQKLEEGIAAVAAERAELARQSEAAGVREALIVEKAQGLERQIEDLTARLAAASATLKQRDQALEEARGSIARLVQQKDADAQAHAKTVDALATERERLTERTAARERRLLEDVDRARQETKTAAKAAADMQKQFDKERAELERSTQSTLKTLQALQVEHAAVRERLAAAERRVKELQTAAAKPAKAAPRRRAAKAA